MSIERFSVLYGILLKNRITSTFGSKILLCFFYFSENVYPNMTSPWTLYYVSYHAYHLNFDQHKQMNLHCLKRNHFSHYPIKFKCCPHTETSQLTCTANQLTGFYMRATLALNGLNQSTKPLLHYKQSNHLVICDELKRKCNVNSSVLLSNKSKKIMEKP